MLREQRRRFEQEMELMDYQQRKEEEEIMKMAEDLGRMTASSGQQGLQGHQSEPTTPPEHRDAGFPSLFSRPGRLSTASLASPPNLTNLTNGHSIAHSHAHLITPPSESDHSQAATAALNKPSHSVPSSRRNSDEKEPQPPPTQQPVQAPVGQKAVTA